MLLSLGSLLLSFWEGDPLQTLLFLSLILLILLYYVQRRKRHLNYPPSPSWLFILGNMFQMYNKKPNAVMQKFAKKYGNIFCTRVGSLTSVVVSGLPLIKEVLINQDQVFIDRPQVPLRFHVSKTFGLIMASGQEWKNQRRFTLMTLRNFGLGKKTLEYRIQEEARYLIEAIREEKAKRSLQRTCNNERVQEGEEVLLRLDIGQPFDPHFQINNAVSNIICSITFGNRFEYHDSQFKELLKTLDDLVVLGTKWECQLFNILPGIMKLLPGSHQKLFKKWKELETFVEQSIKQHKEDLNPEEASDFIDAYLKELSKDNIHSSFNEKNLVFCTLDLFIAGTETTSTTLRWGLLYMALNPEIQGKIQAEIDSVIGQSRQPAMADKENLPYTYAAVHEVQRMGDIVPFNVPRIARVDTTVAGYYVPKGAVLMTNLTGLHKDPSEWATPEIFNPEHFVENGQFKKREAFLPFSIGKRFCLGEQLARTELFIFFTSLLQKFTFQAPRNTQLSLESRGGINVSPVPYQICAIPRDI